MIMKLFHCSNAKINDFLIPKVCDDCSGDAGGGANKAVVYLSDFERHNFAKSGKFCRYQYEVDIQKDNPHLSIDEDFSQGMKSMASLGLTNRNTTKHTRWYCYSKKIKIVKRSLWNEATSSYEKDPTWNAEIS